MAFSRRIKKARREAQQLDVTLALRALDVQLITGTATLLAGAR